MKTLPPLPDLLTLYTHQKDALDAAYHRVMDSGWYILGKEVTAFEQEFAAFCGLQHCISVANGTDAVELALRAVGVERGDRVITVSHTAVATVAAIERLGAQALLVDVDPQRYTMCPDSLAQCLEAETKQNSNVKAIVPVHIYGQCADMDAIMPLAQHYGCKIVEDCAQAHGAFLHGKIAGSMGHAAAFSFYPTKNLGAFGDGGAVLTPHADVAHNASLLRQYGWEKRYESTIVGVNSRLDELQAAFLRVRLQNLTTENSLRQDRAAQYCSLLTDTNVQLPHPARGCSHVYHLFVIQSQQRNALMQKLREAGITTAIHYPSPIHTQRTYRARLKLAPQGLPHTEALYERIVSLPLHPYLREVDVQQICECIQK